MRIMQIVVGMSESAEETEQQSPVVHLSVLANPQKVQGSEIQYSEKRPVRSVTRQHVSVGERCEAINLSAIRLHPSRAVQYAASRDP